MRLFKPKGLGDSKLDAGPDCLYNDEAGFSSIEQLVRAVAVRAVLVSSFFP